MLRYFYTFSLILIYLNTFTQSIPELSISDEKIFYLGVYNEVNLNLNGCDESQIKLKAKDATLRKINDTLYSVYLRGLNDEQEMKLKMYYKNLPVDIKNIPIKGSPVLQISLNEENKVAQIPIGEIAKTKIDIRFDDESLNREGYEVFSFNIKYRNAQNKIIPIASSRYPELSVLEKFLNRLKPGDSIIFSDFRMKSRQNNVINCQSNYFEIVLTE